MKLLMSVPSRSGNTLSKSDSQMRRLKSLILIHLIRTKLRGLGRWTAIQSGSVIRDDRRIRWRSPDSFLIPEKSERGVMLMNGNAFNEILGVL
jgi:hypothetical protein